MAKKRALSRKLACHYCGREGGNCLDRTVQVGKKCCPTCYHPWSEEISEAEYEIDPIIDEAPIKELFDDYDKEARRRDGWRN